MKGIEMATTVKADDVARTACKNFLNIINQQLGPAFTALSKNGGTLADGTHWQGTDASTFANTIWPQAQKDITSMHNNLTDLQNKVGKVLDDIMKAGGNA
jgi:hypothetical protein